MVRMIEERVFQRILDAFYPMPTWYVWSATNTVRSASENLPDYGMKELLELRWRMVWRNRLDPGAHLDERIALVDEWIQQELRTADRIERVASEGVTWGPRPEVWEDDQLSARGKRFWR